MIEQVQAHGSAADAILGVHAFRPAERPCLGEAMLPRFELVTIALSALSWRAHNGPIRLFTDSRGADSLEAAGLLALWDAGVDASTLEARSRDIDPVAFWAAPKVLALSVVPSPCALLDTDLIVWRPVGEGIVEAELVVAHREPLDPSVYVAREVLGTPPGYGFPTEWDWNEPACNTAFVYMANEELRITYTREALRFMRGNAHRDFGCLTQMVFAEQRLLAMCARALGVEVGVLLGGPQHTWDEQDLVTHLWGHKSLLRADARREEAYCRAALARIGELHPDWYDPIAAALRMRSERASRRR